MLSKLFYRRWHNLIYPNFLLFKFFQLVFRAFFSVITLSKSVLSCLNSKLLDPIFSFRVLFSNFLYFSSALIWERWTSSKCQTHNEPRIPNIYPLLLGVKKTWVVDPDPFHPGSVPFCLPDPYYGLGMNPDRYNRKGKI